MERKIKCQGIGMQSTMIRIRVVKAPLVDSRDLRDVVFARAKALVI